MALLKGMDPVPDAIFFHLFPWMKIHGSIEGWHRRSHRFQLHSSFHEWKFMALLKVHIHDLYGAKEICFHEWKFMALLKVLSLILPTRINAGFHEWKFMALLKELSQQQVLKHTSQVSMNENSWLYWRALPVRGNPTAWGWFPWMKIHGSIEGWVAPAHLSCSISFPWMKIHGSIEGQAYDSCILMIMSVSMNENSWLYWRLPTSFFWKSNKPGFHEWKFMALLKAYRICRYFYGYITFPWMKIHGSIEGIWTTGRSGKTF